MALAGAASLALILQVALRMRLVTAAAVDLYVHRGGSDRLCLFPDTTIYWGLARTIRTGRTVRISGMERYPSLRPAHARLPTVSGSLPGSVRPADTGRSDRPGRPGNPERLPGLPAHTATGGSQPTRLDLRARGRARGPPLGRGARLRSIPIAYSCHRLFYLKRYLCR